MTSRANSNNTSSFNTPTLPSEAARGPFTGHGFTQRLELVQSLPSSQHCWRLDLIEFTKKCQTNSMEGRDESIKTTITSMEVAIQFPNSDPPMALLTFWERHYLTSLVDMESTAKSQGDFLVTVSNKCKFRVWFGLVCASPPSFDQRRDTWRFIHIQHQTCKKRDPQRLHLLPNSI